MQRNRPPFVKFKFENAFIIAPWIFLFEQKPGWNGTPPYYCVEVMIEKKSRTLKDLKDKLNEYEQNRTIRQGYYPVVRELNLKNHDKEIELLGSKGLSIHDYAVLYLKRKSGEPDLVSKDNQKLPRQPQFKKLFTRGTKVNVIAALGVNTAVGQPYLSLTGVQNVGIGFSNMIPQDAPQTTAFSPVQGTSADHAFSNIGVNMTKPIQPTCKEEEEMLNQMLAGQYTDDDVAPF